VDVLIGIDESGTGALAGPFTVCGVLAYEKDADLLREVGANDSKALSDKARRKAFPLVVDVILGAWCEVVPAAATFNPGQKPAWRIAATACVRKLVQLLPDDPSEVRVIVDGNADERLRRAIKDIPQIDVVRFRKKADAIYPAVGAASIIAKTIRNNKMIALHRRYPEYGWDRNYGYFGGKRGVHLRAIQRHGVSPEHRFIKTLVGMKKRKAHEEPSDRNLSSRRRRVL
jgi:ribonuclease HII